MADHDPRATVEALAQGVEQATTRAARQSSEEDDDDDHDGGGRAKANACGEEATEIESGSEERYGETPDGGGGKEAAGRIAEATPQMV